eukprot:CAMPEP_0114668980 /NCGR_PEP_ID=MMETSP0191-20121206/37249_1 /TAXON_ID=126664 /ORGANISM="Sorites sp." /LENGTH=185 /DNA_ID=CAMNT_0001923463 /DNA_START=56 /DNA_END=613 /DNA_ORIENTATION=+
MVAARWVSFGLLNWLCQQVSAGNLISQAENKTTIHRRPLIFKEYEEKEEESESMEECLKILKSIHGEHVIYEEQACGEVVFDEKKVTLDLSKDCGPGKAGKADNACPSMVVLKDVQAPAIKVINCQPDVKYTLINYGYSEAAVVLHTDSSDSSIQIPDSYAEFVIPPSGGGSCLCSHEGYLSWCD